MSVGKKILAVVLSSILLVVGSGAVYLFNIRSSISGASIDDSAVSVNKYLNHDVINLALFGVDGRPDVEGNRSDTIMIISINFKTGKAVRRNGVYHAHRSDRRDSRHDTTIDITEQSEHTDMTAAALC